MLIDADARPDPPSVRRAIELKEELQKYITGIIRKKEQKLIEINCMPDHAHLLIGLRPNVALSDLIRDVKSASSDFINRKRWIRGKFKWQEGFGAFSYSHCTWTL